MTREELRDRMSARELDDWKAKFFIEPFGSEQVITLLAALCAKMHNSWRGKGDEAVNPQDFLPSLEVEEAPPTGLALKHKAAGIFARVKADGDNRNTNDATGG